MPMKKLKSCPWPTVNSTFKKKLTCCLWWCEGGGESSLRSRSAAAPQSRSIGSCLTSSTSLGDGLPLELDTPFPLFPAAASLWLFSLEFKWCFVEKSAGVSWGMCEASSVLLLSWRGLFAAASGELSEDRDTLRGWWLRLSSWWTEGGCASRASSSFSQ